MGRSPSSEVPSPEPAQTAADVHLWAFTRQRRREDMAAAGGDVTQDDLNCSQAVSLAICA